MKNKLLLSVLLIVTFTMGVVSVVIPVRGRIDGDLTIVMPDKVVPGGAILLEFDGDNGGTAYFYLSENDEEEITRRDTYLGRARDVEDDEGQVTVIIPKKVRADDYYVKITDRKRRYAHAVVSGGQIEVIEKVDRPTISVNPESDVVWKPFPDEEYNTVDVHGEDIDTAYDYAYLYWDKYQGDIDVDYQGEMEDDLSVAEWEVDEDGEFDAEDVALTEAFMGEHPILVILWDASDTFPDGTLGTFVEFDVEPSIDVDPISVGAEALADQDVDIYAHGFPEGTIEEDTIEFTVRDIKTGRSRSRSVIDWVEHDEVDVEDDPPGTFEVGGAWLTTTSDEVPAGLIDIKFKVDRETFTIERQILSSEDSDDDEMKGTVRPNSGKAGDEVWFYVIDFPAGADVDIVFRGEDDDFSLVEDFGLILDPADLNGAWKYRFELEEMAGGEYDVEAWDLTNDDWETIGEFKVLPKVEFFDEPWTEGLGDIETIYVDEPFWIRGTGFQEDAEFDTIVIGGKKIELDPTIEVDEDGVFYYDYNDYEEPVPSVRRGGRKVSVTIKGEDSDGRSVTVKTSIIIEQQEAAT